MTHISHPSVFLFPLLKKNSLFNQSPSRNCSMLVSLYTASDSDCIFFVIYTIFKYPTQINTQTLMRGFLWFSSPFYDIYLLPYWTFQRTRGTFFKQKICSVNQSFPRSSPDSVYEHHFPIISTKFYLPYHHYHSLRRHFCNSQRSTLSSLPQLS